MKHFTIRSGLKSETRGAPAQRVDEAVSVVSSALVGADYPGLRPHFDLSEGDAVRVGQSLFSDRRDRAIQFVAPISGTVKRVDYGPRRTLSAVVIEPADESGPSLSEATDPIEADTPQAVRATLLERGLWPAFLTRPYGRIPASDAAPDAIFVNAVQQGPLAPAPVVVLADREEAFADGLQRLTQLTDGPVHLCQGSQTPLLKTMPDRVEPTFFKGAGAAALTGTHIDRLHPLGSKTQVWSIGYQDVMAIGHLFRTGAYDTTRVIAISGPRAARPRLIRACLGADLRVLTGGEVADDRRGRPASILSGDSVTGRPAAYLGRYHTQVTITHVDRAMALAGGAVRPIVPTAALDGALPFNTFAVPLMRALSVGDIETAARLGCLSMVEEDVAVLSRLCASGADYGQLLRQMLDALEKDAA